MRKLLSFIGTGRLLETIYLLGEEEYHTSVIQEALCRHYKPDMVVLFVTTEAKRINLPAVQAALAPIQPILVDIPDGKCEEEIWEIFSTVTNAVDEGDDIIFDITHGFRSLPFIALLSIAYLKEIKPFTLSGVVYGAFEAGEKISLDNEKSISRAPVFDLSRFVTIFDWMAGIRSFLYHADAGKLVQMIKQVSKEEYLQSQGNIGTRGLTALSGPISQYASSVRLARPVEAMKGAFNIQERLGAATDAINEHTPVLIPLLSRVSEIGNFALSEPELLTDLVIEKQRDLIQVQLDMGLYQQAVTMGREWMVSLLLFAAGAGDQWLKKDARYEAERSLSGAEKLLSSQSRGLSSAGDEEKPEFLDWILRNESWKELAGIWSRTSQLRNELAHCGMNPDSLKVSQLQKQVNKFPGSLDKFYKLMMRETGKSG